MGLGLFLTGCASDGANNDASLAVLSLSSGTISPTFDNSTLDYTAAVENSVASIAVTATPSSSTAKVAATMNSATIDLAKVSLSVAENPIKILVTAEDGSTTKTYTLKITRASSSSSTDASLASLSLSNVTLSPSFDPATTSYSASAAKTTASMTVAATANSTGAKVSATKDGAAYTLGQDTALSVGTSVIIVTVTAADGKTTKAYTVTITRDGGVGLTITVSLASYGELSFSGQGSTLNAGESWTIKPSFSNASAYAWYRDTVKVSTDSSYTVSASSLLPGYHTIGLSATVDGRVYFSSFSFVSK
jgi:hypothetical protein